MQDGSGDTGCRCYVPLASPHAGTVLPVQTPADLIYRSDRKLFDVADHLGVNTTWFKTTLTVSRSGKARLPIAPGTSVSASGEEQGERVGPDQERRARDRILRDVVDALERPEPLPLLDDLGWKGGTPREGEWFRFRRRLRFGLGQSDSDHSVKAIVFVDAEAVDLDDGVCPGLLMTGAPVHLLEPFASAASEAPGGARSGSGTGELFRWARERNAAIRPDRRTGFTGPAAALFHANPVSDEPGTALAMYALFARDDWMAPSFGGIDRPVTCEGVAIASLVVTQDEAGLVLGSPLYVRVCTGDHLDPAPEPREPRRRLRSPLRGRWGSRS